MRFSAMRRMAGLALALVWGGARLAQPLQPECPHHAVAVAVAVAVAAPEAPVTMPVATPAALEAHAPHHAMAAEVVPAVAAPSEPPVSHHPANSDAPCECAAHCCAASAVAIAPTVDTHVATIAAPSRALVAPVHVDAPRARLSVRQPPATAPPTTNVV